VQQQDQQLPLLTQSSQPLFSCLDSLLSPQQKKHTHTHKNKLLACWLASFLPSTPQQHTTTNTSTTEREREFRISISVVVMYLLGTVIGRRTLDGVETAAAAQNSNHDKDEDDDNDSPKHKAISIIIIIIIII
jgi:Ca2+/H+ antiporter